MIHLVKPLAVIVSGFLLFLTGVGFGLFLAQPGGSEKENRKKIHGQKISGEEISVKSFSLSTGTFSFSTHAEGKGDAIMTVPKILIPEARDHMLRTHTVSAGAGYLFSGPFSEPFITMGYLKRKENMSLGGGVLFSRHTAGAYGSLQYGF